MSFAAIDHASGTNSDHNSAQSADLNSTGAAVAFAEIQFSGAQGDCVITSPDPKGNVWQRASHKDDGSGRSVEIWYSNLTSVGSGHHITATGTSTFPSVNWEAFSGGTVTLGSTNGSTNASAGTLATGSVSTAPGQIVIAAARVSGGGNSIVSVDSSFNLDVKNANDANNVASGMAWFGETTTTTRNPTFTFGFADTCVATISTFQGLITIAPGTGSIAYTGGAPSLRLQIGVPSGSVAYSGIAPTLYISPTLVNSGSLIYTGYAPSLRLQIGVNSGSLAYQGYAPNIVNSITRSPGAGSIAYTGYAPTVSFDYLNPAHVWLTENGVTIDPLDGNITEYADVTPNRMTFVVRQTRPQEGDTVYAYLGSPSNNADPKFGGTITSVQTLSGESSDPLLTRFSCVALDWAWPLQEGPKVNLTFTGISGDVIAATLIALAPGYTGNHVQSGLAIVPLIVFKNASVMDCLKQLRDYLNTQYVNDVNLKVDYLKDIHLVVGADASIPTPVQIDANHPTLNGFMWTRDIQPMVTRAVTSGDGSTSEGAAVVGESIIPLKDVTFASDLGGYVEIAGGTQRLSYTGRQLGVGGSLVGPGASPNNAPALALAVGAGVDTGNHTYGVVFRTGNDSQLSLPSALTSITTGPIVPPTVAPTGVLSGLGGNVDAGPHQYAVVYGDGAGHTTPGPTFSITPWRIAEPSETLLGVRKSPYWTTQGFAPGTTVYLRLTLIGGGGGETLVGTNVISYVVEAGSGGGSAAVYFDYPTSSQSCPLGTMFYNVYASLDPSGSSIGWHYIASGSQGQSDSGFGDHILGAFSPLAPSANTLCQQTISLTVPNGPDGTVTKDVYRTAASASQLKYAGTVPDNVTTGFIDTLADSGLGANAPTSNTTALNHVNLSSIPLGPLGGSVTQRWIVRSAVGSPQLKIAFKILNNVDTAATDSTADASLGANAPTSDTSGLAQPPGQILPGQTALLVAGPVDFPSTGGWAIIGNGQQCIRYTGILGTTLIGVPSSGVGSITGPITYGSSVTPAPALTGIPTSLTPGAEQLTNPDFTGSATGWTLGTNWAYGANAITHTAGNTASFSQALVRTAESYQITVLLSAGSSTTPSSLYFGGVLVDTYIGTDRGPYVRTVIPIDDSGVVFIPASDFDGTITTISAKPFVPAAVPDSLLYALNKGDAVSLLSIRDDVPGQTALAALLNSDGHTPPSDGVFEDYVALGNGVPQAACDNAGDARLAQSASPIIYASWVSNDPMTTAGATVSIIRSDLATSLVVQQVSISQWNRVPLRSTKVTPDQHEYPIYQVSQAGNQRFALDRFMRRQQATT